MSKVVRAWGFLLRGGGVSVFYLLVYFYFLFCSAWRPSFWLVHSPVIIIEGFHWRIFLLYLWEGGGVAFSEFDLLGREMNQLSFTEFSFAWFSFPVHVHIRGTINR